MELVGQWPSRAGDVDKVYARGIRASALKMSEYVPSDEAPPYLAEALRVLGQWPEVGADLLSEEQLAIRKRVTVLYDRWTNERRLLLQIK